MDPGTIEFGRRMGIAINDDGTFPDLEAKKAAGKVHDPGPMIDNWLFLSWPPPFSTLTSRVTIEGDGTTHYLVEYQNGEVCFVRDGEPGRGIPYEHPLSPRMATIDYGGHIFADRSRRGAKKNRPYHAVNRGRELMSMWNKCRAWHRLQESQFTVEIAATLLMCGRTIVSPWYKMPKDPAFREIPDAMLEQLNYYRVLMIAIGQPVLVDEEAAKAFMWVTRQ